MNRKKEEEKIDLKIPIISIVGIILLTLFGYLIFFKQSDEQKLLTTWKLVEYHDGDYTEKVSYTYQITFYKDGKIQLNENFNQKELNVTNYKYELNKKNIKITSKDTIEKMDLNGKYEFKISGRKLIFTNGDLRLTFEKL